MRKEPPRWIRTREKYQKKCDKDLNISLENRVPKNLWQSFNRFVQNHKLWRRKVSLRKNLRGTYEKFSLRRWFFELFAWVHSVVFTFSSIAFLFCGFCGSFSFYFLILYYMYIVSYSLYWVFGISPFSYQLVEGLNFPQNFQTVNKSLVWPVLYEVIEVI